MNDEPDPYWASAAIVRSRDLTVLRPANLPKGKRFETGEDVTIYSEQLENRLLHANSCSMHAETPQDCRQGYCRCAEPFCPLCARLFRRWLFSESSRALKSGPTHVFTAYFGPLPPGELGSADPIQLKDRLRRRMNRAGLESALAVGGIEAALKESAWNLHSHVLTIGADERSLKRLRPAESDLEVRRPLVVQPIVDPKEQASYVLKFYSYHRPTRTRAAFPLKPDAARELVAWQANHKFEDFLFLKGLRRRGTALSRR